MFQDGQLFDHLTVARNVGYALRLRRAPDTDAAGRRAARPRRPPVVRRPDAGHPVRRRAAAGRAGPVARRASRGCCCSTSRCRRSTPGCASGWPATCGRILREAGTTALLVTHDHDEAFAVADRLAVMRAGRIVQQGDIAEVWRAPVDADDRAVPRLRRGCSTGSTPRGCSRAAGLAAGARPSRCAARRWSVDDAGPLRGDAWSPRGSPPSRSGCEVDVPGAGRLDAVAPLDRHPGTGRPGRPAGRPHPAGAGRRR